MKYMVIEKFKPGLTDSVYERFREKGRMLPEGLFYIDSWLALDRTTCFQLMATDRYELFAEWTSRWQDLVDFEIVPVQNSPSQTGAAAARPHDPVFS
jgi:hypothetical protein